MNIEEITPPITRLFTIRLSEPELRALRTIASLDVTIPVKLRDEGYNENVVRAVNEVLWAIQAQVNGFGITRYFSDGKQ